MSEPKFYETVDGDICYNKELEDGTVEQYEIKKEKIVDFLNEQDEKFTKLVTKIKEG